MLELKGRGVIITGAKRVGQNVVRRLVAEGMYPAILYRGSKETAEQLRDEALEHVDRACAIQADLTVEAEVERAVAEAKRQLGDVSFCVSLASDYPRVKLDDLDEAAWERGISSAKATYLMAVHASKVMRQNQGPIRGHLVFFGDWAAEETPYEDFLPYLTGKAAIHFMTRAFGVELAPHGILVNAILPGPTAQPDRTVTSEEWTKALAATPLHVPSSADDMAEMIATLLKLETITGEIIRVDAGRHLAGPGGSNR
ncbi:MAG TPA: SDR family oxidoreductase [Dehalococcoidia bacterium]|nr:SDR family oxidoreductase [Dehalococcoidia bacterium]